MNLSIHSSSYSQVSFHPVTSFVVCSFFALKISRLFAEKIHLLKLNKQNTSLFKKLGVCMIQVSAFASSLTYSTASIFAFFAAYIAAVVISRHFQKPNPPESANVFTHAILNSKILSHIGENEDPISRFKLFAHIAETNRVFYANAQKERAKILNDHPEISSFSFFNSFEEMVHFAKSYDVRKLNLSTSSLEKAQIEMLIHQLPNLTYLDLSDCQKIDDSCLLLISSHLKALTSLNISLCKSPSSKGIEALSALKELTSLDMSACTGVEDASLQKIAPYLTKLTHLKIAHGLEKVQTDGIKALAALTNLTHLDASGCGGVDDESLQLLASYLPNLTHLTIKSCGGFEPLSAAAIQNFTSLTYLDAHKCQMMNDSNLRTIISHLPNLTYLRISNCPHISSNGIKAIKDLRSLTHLDMSFCEVDDASLQEIVPHLSNLTHLKVNECEKIRDAGIQAISRLTTLVRLDMARSAGTSSGIEAIKNLANLSYLNVLSNNGVDDASLHTIASHLTKLRYLNISLCRRVSRAGLENLVFLPHLSHLDISFSSEVDDTFLQLITGHLTQLTKLRLNFCNCINSIGMQALASLKKLTSLSVIHCKGIDDTSLCTIVSQLKKLSHLDISECQKVSFESVKAIASYLPHLSFLSIQNCIYIDRLEARLVLPKTKIDDTPILIQHRL